MVAEVRLLDDWPEYSMENSMGWKFTAYLAIVSGGQGSGAAAADRILPSRYGLISGV